jgi:ferredoxin-type protein NapG
VALGTGKIGDHYRLGWEEKKKKGEALVPGLIELPKRMPGATP